MTDERWNEGFYAGVLSALAVIGEDSTAYREIVVACGAKELLAAAVRENDMETKRLRAVVADIYRRRAAHAKRIAAGSERPEGETA